MIKRIFLAILVAVLAVLLIPELRLRFQPEIEASRAWLGEKLEGPMSPVLTPYRTIQTQSTMSDATRELVRDRNRGKDRPRPIGFNQYMLNRGIKTVDEWGTPLMLDPTRDSVTVRSAGPDLQFWTEDDVAEQIRYPEPPRRRRR